MNLSTLIARSELDPADAQSLAERLCKEGAIYSTVAADVFCLVEDLDAGVEHPVETKVSLSERIRVSAPLRERKVDGSTAIPTVSQLREIFPAFPVDTLLCQFEGTEMTEDCVPCHADSNFLAHLWNVFL